MATVLVVDDHPPNRALLETLLGYAGHRTLAAGDGLDALQQVRSSRPDLVICDILMPTMDGYEFVRYLRSDAEIADTEVIFHTAAFHELEAQKLASACGVSRLLTKPCEPEVILSTVADALAHTARPQSTLGTDLDGFDREHLRLLTDKLSSNVDLLLAANRRLTALTELSLQLASERDPQRLLEQFCRGVRELFGARYAVLTVRDKHTQQNLLTVMRGLDERWTDRFASWGVNTAPFADAMARRTPLRYRWDDLPQVLAELPQGPYPQQGVLIAPFASPDTVYGWVMLVDRVGGDSFGEDDAQMLSIHAAHTGRIYENGSLYARVRQHADQLQQALEQQQASEERLASLVHNALDAIVAVDESGCIALFNPAAETMFGYRAEQLVGQPFAQLLPPARRNDTLDSKGDPPAGLTAGAVTGFVGQHSNGTELQIEGSVSPALSGPRHLYTLILRDVTERRRAEERVRHLNRVYSVLSLINALIVRVPERQELFDSVCRIAIDAGCFRHAWIALVDKASGRLKRVAMRSALAPAGASMELPVPLPGPLTAGERLHNTLVRQRRPVVVNDTRAELSWVGLAPPQPGRAFVWLPLFASSEFAGVLALDADETGFFDEEEMRLLRELAGDVSYALDHLAQRDRLNSLAYYDTLTGLANATLFTERLRLYVAAAHDSGQSLALVMLDLERFKGINDTLGRTVGDALLQLVARRLEEYCGETRQLGRIAVDRFAVVVPDVRGASELARYVAESMQSCFRPPFQLDGRAVPIGAKAGVAMFPGDGQDAQTLFRNAESALKKARQDGERWQFYDQATSDTVSRKLLLGHELRHACEQGEFVLHYQPQVSLRDRSLQGLEALIRWNSPTRGLVSPAEFISVLEETGLILDAGAWALQRAAQDHKRWRQAGLNPPRISVNVSALQLRQDNFVDTVKQAQAVAGGEQALDIEITETLLVGDLARTVDKLVALRAIGVEVAIDDFGTGYSSLAYLARLPVQVLKIDRLFVATMLQDGNTMTLVETMITLAHALKLRVIAEGVETQEQAEQLLRCGCDQMQGFLISPAVDFERISVQMRRYAGLKA